MPETKKPEETKASEAAVPAKQYRILSGGVSLASGGAAFNGEVVDGARIGDVERIQKLIDRGSIEEA